MQDAKNAPQKSPKNAKYFAVIAKNAVDFERLAVSSRRLLAVLSLHEKQAPKS